ncbi:MAG: GGDEF domain-containing protein [Treponema sp.]|nr:GGDEF domain-containing protein [Treponema sp.]
MQLSIALNSILGSCFVLGLIFADYIRKHNTDSFQRSLFLTLLVSIFVAIVCDFFFFAFEGVPGEVIHILMVVVLTIYYIFQVTAYYFVFVFIDYLVYNDKARTKKVICIVKCITALHLAALVLNYWLHFYFSVSEDNLLIREKLYAIRLIISYFPVVFFIFEFIVSPKKFYKIHIYLICFFVVLTGGGATIDIILNSGALIWPCLSSALLYSYFFIIRTDSRIDILTGIGNRYAFNEFITNLSRQTAKQSYSIVMIDMDHFKQINDTLGHLEGDNALQDMAAIIKGNLRSNDFAARYGGDEFVVAAKADFDINHIMERIQAAIDNQNSKNLRPYKIEISYGIGVFTPCGNQSIEEFLVHIDGLMYKHKAEHHRRRHTDNIVP